MTYWNTVIFHVFFRFLNPYTRVMITLKISTSPLPSATSLTSLQCISHEHSPVHILQATLCLKVCFQKSQPKMGLSAKMVPLGSFTHILIILSLLTTLLRIPFEDLFLELETHLGRDLPRTAKSLPSGGYVCMVYGNSQKLF